MCIRDRTQPTCGLINKLHTKMYNVGLCFDPSHWEFSSEPQSDRKYVQQMVVEQYPTTFTRYKQPLFYFNLNKPGFIST